MLRWMMGAAAALLLAGTAQAAPRFDNGPYKHAPLGRDGDGAQMHALQAPAAPLPQVLPPGTTVVRWAFATGDCGDERWGEGLDTARFATANVQAFRDAKLPYVVSTGGQGGEFRCATAEGMERFLARYASPQFQGVDLDIEAGQSDADIDALVREARAAQQRHPELRFSFTLPTFAASEGSGRSLNALGERVLAALRRHRFDRARINLMAMDYGDAKPAHCVVQATREGPRCDMAASALQAARNLHTRHGWAYGRIELTAMIGVNDVVQNVFTLADARRLAREARRLGLAGLYYWSLDRDRPCAAPTPGASAECSGLEAPPGAFGAALANVHE